MKLKLGPEPLPLEADERGTVRVGGTRIPLDTVVSAYRLGEMPEEVVIDFPTLRLEDVYFVFGYYLRHRAEVDSYIAERERRAAELRAEIEAHPSQSGVQKRMQALLRERSGTPSRS